MRLIVLVCAAAGVASAGAALAQDKGKPPPEQLTTLLACRSQPTDAARLACYDAAVASLARATEQGQVVVVDREEIRRTRRSLFGFSLPDVPFLGGGKDDKDPQPDFIETTIKWARPTDFNKWLFEIEDGALWQTTEANTRGATPKAGDKVRIKKAAMGSYLISFKNSRSLRGMRVR